jgi:protein-L-isoaspartate O-methyltransferase
MRRNAKYELVTVFITDSKEAPLPPPSTGPKVKIDGPERAEDATEPRVYVPREQSKADQIKEALKTGIQVVSANQLFPTPPELVARMVEIANIQPGHAVLEPSAGTGRILEALPCVRPNGYIQAVEINPTLAAMLEKSGHADDVVCFDFLEWAGPEKFDRILMNPPFENGADIKHILKARELLRPGGLLVAICAGGPRQKEKLEPLTSLWEPLPAGTFQESGTNVNTVLLTIEA